jgi:hypothetical protein
MAEKSFAQRACANLIRAQSWRAWSPSRWSNRSQDGMTAAAQRKSQILLNFVFELVSLILMVGVD